VVKNDHFEIKVVLFRARTIFDQSWRADNDLSESDHISFSDVFFKVIKNLQIKKNEFKNKFKSYESLSCLTILRKRDQWPEKTFRMSHFQNNSTNKFSRELSEIDL